MDNPETEATLCTRHRTQTKRQKQLTKLSHKATRVILTWIIHFRYFATTLGSPWLFDWIRVALWLSFVSCFCLFVCVLCLVHNVASVSGLSIRDCPFVFHIILLHQKSLYKTWIKIEYIINPLVKGITISKYYWLSELFLTKIKFNPKIENQNC
jgi:hypothetical protein